MEHIKDIHGREPCKMFAQNKCARGSRCWFSHERIQHNQQNASSVGEQDFQQTPTRRLYSSVVGAQTSQVHQVSEQIQNQNILQATQQILPQIMPNLVDRILLALKQRQAVTVVNKVFQQIIIQSLMNLLKRHIQIV